MLPEKLHSNIAPVLVGLLAIAIAIVAAFFNTFSWTSLSPSSSLSLLISSLLSQSHGSNFNLGHSKCSYSPASKLINYLIEQPTADLHFRIPIYLTSDDGFNFPDLAEATQLQLDYELLRRNLTIDYSFDIINNYNNQYSDYIEKHKPYEVKYIVGDSLGIYTDSFERFALLFLESQTIQSNDLPFFITQTIMSNIFGEEIETVLDHVTFNDANSCDVVFRTSSAVEKLINKTTTANYNNNNDNDSTSLPIFLNFVLLLDNQVLSIDLGIKNLIDSYIESLNALFQDLYKFELNFVLENVTDYLSSGHERTQSLYQIDTLANNANNENKHINSSSATYILNTNHGVVPINTSEPYNQDPVSSTEFIHYNFLLNVLFPNQSNINILQIIDNDTSQPVTVFKNAVEKSVWINDVVQAHDLNEIGDDKEDYNANTNGNYNTTSNRQKFYFIDRNDFKDAMERTLHHFYTVLSMPKQIETKAVVKMDSWIRMSLVKNLHKIAFRLLKVEELLIVRLGSNVDNDNDNDNDEKDTNDKPMSRAKVMDELLKIIKVRQDAVRLVNNKQDEKIALNKLMKANVRLKRIIFLLQKKVIN